MTNFQADRWYGLKDAIICLNGDVQVGDMVFSDSVTTHCWDRQDRPSKRFYCSDDPSIDIMAHCLGYQADSQFCDWIVSAHRIMDLLWQGHTVGRISNSGDSIVECKYDVTTHELTITEKKRGDWGLNCHPYWNEEKPDRCPTIINISEVE